VGVTRESLVRILEPAVEALGYELTDLEVSLGRRGGVVRLFIDHADGITLEDCERVSRQVSRLLDVEDPIPGDYNLEVSSPGLDRKLVKPADFERFAGSLVSVRLRQLTDGRRRLQGKLLGRDGEQAVIESEGTEYRIPLMEIEVARLVPELAAGPAGRAQ
jgi:ribosome maturation factor RimP